MPKTKLSVNSSSRSATAVEFSGFLSRQEHEASATRKSQRQRQRKGARRKNSSSTRTEPTTLNATGAEALATRRSQGRKQRKRTRRNSSSTGTEPATSIGTGTASPTASSLHWHTPRPHVPLQCEEKMVEVVIRWKETERGMMRSQPTFRLKEIKKKCRSTGMYLSQALSLRRHHLQLNNPTRRLQQLGLGDYAMIKESATIFESAVAEYLDECAISYHDEADQKKIFYKNQKENDLMPPTPDFLLKDAVDLFENTSGRGRHRIRWIEAKMFYGASTIPHDNKSAVGSIMRTARKYVEAYGPGAMVFSFGCGDVLARQLLDIGVCALDAEPLDLRDMERHQRTWCANKNGEILP